MPSWMLTTNHIFSVSVWKIPRLLTELRTTYLFLQEIKSRSWKGLMTRMRHWDTLTNSPINSDMSTMALEHWRTQWQVTLQHWDPHSPTLVQFPCIWWRTAPISVTGRRSSKPVETFRSVKMLLTQSYVGGTEQPIRTSTSWLIKENLLIYEQDDAPLVPKVLFIHFPSLSLPTRRQEDSLSLRTKWQGRGDRYPRHLLEGAESE